MGSVTLDMFFFFLSFHHLCLLAKSVFKELPGLESGERIVT